MKTTTTNLKAGEVVAVYGRPGVVKYLKAGNWLGVALLNEAGRVDEWQACQVRPVSPEEAAALALMA